jgi:signal transduction histidine kinase
MIVSREIQIGNSTYMVSASPVTEINGETLGVVAVLRDITALKRLETTKSMFVSMMAHEVKGPLSAIEGLLNVVCTGIGGADPQRDSRMVQRALLRVKALRTMVAELINLTSIQTGHFALRRVPLNLTEVVREVVQTCKPKADEKSIELTLEERCPDVEMNVLADRNAITSIFTNLVDNAIKYTPDKGRVNVCVDRIGPYALVRVRDNGIGMTAEEKGRIFEEFYRAKNEYTDRVPGTGLGLAIVKNLLDMHQGEVTVQSSPRQGSEFTVRLELAGHELGLVNK